MLRVRAHTLARAAGRGGAGTATTSTRLARGLSTSPQSTQVGGKSWVPQDDSALQKVATQSLIHEVTMAQIRDTEAFIPWFLRNMPASYFRQVPEVLKKQHISTIGALRTIAQSDMVM